MASDVVLEVVAERQAQLAKGFDEGHDDKYDQDELLNAGICYASNKDETAGKPVKWPWHYKWWKPANRRRNIIRALALLLAYVESTDRKTGRKDW